jgi:hypothetical protein
MCCWVDLQEGARRGKDDEAAAATDYPRKPKRVGTVVI